MKCSIIPKPASVSYLEGSFLFRGPISLYCRGEVSMARKFLNRLCKVQEESSENSSFILIQDSSLAGLGQEGYHLKITADRVELRAFTDKGLFYGLQSFRQLLPAESEITDTFYWIPCVEIEDSPAYDWRGFMLDSCRHFHGVERIKEILDILALHKINRFHWHLTEDQGWRLEIKAFPLLTQIGSQRKRTELIDKKSFRHEPHGGFFTQAQVKEILAYASERNIMVIPEVDIPGHSTAALAAYPEYSCSGGPIEVADTFGIFDDLYCAGKEKTFQFLQRIFDEIIELFDAPYIHIGGDEAPVKGWEQCPDCQKRIQEQGLEDEHQLQTWFFNRISTYLLEKGKIPIGWNEVISEGLDKDILVQYWVEDQGKTLEEIRKGRSVIVSKIENYYLDYAYSTTTLKGCYGPIPFEAQLTPGQRQHILGVETPLWTEWVDTPERLYWQLLPRLTAVAESGWTRSDDLDWENFLERLKLFNLRLNAMGIFPASEKFWRRKHNGIIDNSEEAHNQVLLEIDKEYRDR